MHKVILLPQPVFDRPSTIPRKEEISEQLIMKIFMAHITSQFLGSKILFIFLFVRQTYLLTYSMVQSPSWEANWFAASQEIPRIFGRQTININPYSANVENMVSS
jgi:hypothetical protein